MKRRYETRAAASGAFAKHVARGVVTQAQRYEMDVVPGAREGVFVQDAYSTRRFIDCWSGGGIHGLGHRHPEVLRAVREALEQIDIGDHRLISSYRADLASRLSASTNGALPGVIFGSGGGESVDVAIKAARAVTRRTRIISIQGGYHGHTGLALAAGDPAYREMFGASLPGFVQVPFDDLDALEAAIDDRTAALILEPIPVSLGMPLPSPGYLEGAAALCAERGAKLLLDETETGLGRTGRLWAFEHHDVRPDALIVAGGLGGGIIPISATLLTKELHAVFDDHPGIHVSALGGAEIGCAAALAVLDVLEAPGFLARVRAVSDVLGEAFAQLPFEVRRRGLLMGFKLGTMDAGMLLTKMLYDAGVLCAHAPNDPSVLQFMPALIVDDATIAELIPRVRGVFCEDEDV